MKTPDTQPEGTPEESQANGAARCAREPAPFVGDGERKTEPESLVALKQWAEAAINEALNGMELARAIPDLEFQKAVRKAGSALVEIVIRIDLRLSEATAANTGSQSSGPSNLEPSPTNGPGSRIGAPGEAHD